MGRPKRNLVNGGIYHITSRGHNRFEPVGWHFLGWHRNRERIYWGPKQDNSRVSQPHTIQLVVAFYRRRKARLEVSLDLPFHAERRPAPPVNIIQQALQVKAYMQANPHETCLSAAKTLKIHRKRIAKLLQIISALPPDFIEKAKKYTDTKTLCQMSVSRMLQMAKKSSAHCLPI